MMIYLYIYWWKVKFEFIDLLRILTVIGSMYSLIFLQIFEIKLRIVTGSGFVFSIYHHTFIMNR